MIEGRCQCCLQEVGPGLYGPCAECASLPTWYVDHVLQTIGSGIVSLKHIVDPARVSNLWSTGYVFRTSHNYYMRSVKGQCYLKVKHLDAMDIWNQHMAVQLDVWENATEEAQIVKPLEAFFYWGGTQVADFQVGRTQALLPDVTVLARARELTRALASTTTTPIDRISITTRLHANDLAQRMCTDTGYRLFAPRRLTHVAFNHVMPPEVIQFLVGVK